MFLPWVAKDKSSNGDVLGNDEDAIMMSTQGS